MTTVDVSDERRAVLEKRRELRKAKKAKGRAAKEEKQRARLEKKQEVLAKIRAKRESEQAQKSGKGNGYAGANGQNDGGCWLCGETTHRKQDCPNRAAQDLNKTCFQCRKRGHTSQNCPEGNKYGQGGANKSPMVCFNCGSESHSLKDCRAPRIGGGATYATCFVCNQTGHMSSRCPQSTTGVYPKGGCCKVCKSIEHLARDCPVGNISADGSSGVRANKKKTFDDDDDESGNSYSGSKDMGGDALDSFDIDMGDNDDSERKEQAPSWASKSSSKAKNSSKTVKF
ncbi:Zf-cchc type zinc finger protein, partial [Globisporangium splendens]